MASGQITRKEIIEDEALQWGKEYAKNLEGAIEKNKQFVDAILALKEANDKLRNSPDAKTYNDNLKRTNEIGDEAVKIWKEQNQLELALISTKKKNELATESTNKKLIEERYLLQQTNKEIKAQVVSKLQQLTAYQKLNKARTEAQNVLANLLSAEKKNTAEVIIAEREFKKLDVRVKSVDAAINNYSKNIGNYQSAFTGLNNTARELMSTFGVVTGLALFGTIVKDIFNVVKDFDRQLIAVGKTTNIAGEDLKQLGREVVLLGERLDGVSVDGLIKSAEVAGQLGVTGTANILKFSEAIEKLKLTSNIISDEQVGQFAKFIEVSTDSFDNADRLASVITRLGNEFATTESEVLANSTEIQKGIAVYETSAQGVLALGAATSTLGSEAEASRSAIQSTFAIINKAIATGKNLEEILKLTGLTQAELSKQFNKDATGVFVKFVKGLNTAKNEGQNLSLVMDDLGIKEKRAFTVVGALAANYGVLENAMGSASLEYQENLALNKEVEAASESLASIISDIKDNFDAYILSANDANGGTETLAKSLKFLRDNLKDIINFTIKIGAVFFTYIGVMKGVNFILASYSALQTAATVGQIRFALATGIGTKSILAQAEAARAATVAQNGLNIATKATPWGLIIGLLGAVVAAYMVFNDEMSDAEKNIQKIIDANKRLQESEMFYATERDKSNSDRFKAIEDDIKLRRAQGENADKLDKEEIARKKEILSASINTYSELKKIELDRTKNELNNSLARISQYESEMKWFEKNNFRRNPQGNTKEELAELISAEKEKRDVKRASFDENKKLTIEEVSRLNKLIQGLDQDKAVKDAEMRAEEDKKAKAKRLKALKDRYDAEKKAADDEYKLRQFRLQVAIDMDQEIIDNEKKVYTERLEALLDSQQLMSAKRKEQAERELQLLGKYNEETGKFVRELSDSEIKILIETGNLKKKLTNEQILIYESYQNDLTKYAKKGTDEREKLVEQEMTRLKKLIEDKVQDETNMLNQAIAAENNRFLAVGAIEKKSLKDREKAIKDHEDRIYQIKKAAAMDSLQLQIDGLQGLLDANDSAEEKDKISSESRKKLEADLLEYRKQLSELRLQDNEETTAKLILSEEEYNERIKEMGYELKESLVEFANALFEAKIANIDNEITVEQEKYDASITAAGNDQRKKDLITAEHDKKVKVLEAKKREEQKKQAIFNKAIMIAEITMKTAQAIVAALAVGPPQGYVFAALSAAIGLAQLGAVIATPIPKYKNGRFDGPDEFAWTGDGGRSEIISDQDGSNPIVTPDTPTLTFLRKGQRVHKSIDDYNNYMRNSLRENIGNEHRKIQEFQANVNVYNNNTDLLEEMRLTRKAFEKMKTNVTVNVPKSDINHELWKFKNTNW